MTGHAIEARLYAEDPDRGFLPQAGRIDRLRLPASSKEVRVDSGVAEGDRISPYYDPLIAKVIAWGADRGAAVRELADALRQAQIAGVATNASFLSRLVRHEKFAAGEVDTEFIARHERDLFPPGKPGERELTIAGLGVLAWQARIRQDSRKGEKDRSGPWSRSDGWRLNTAHRTIVEFEEAGVLTFDYLPHGGGEMRFSAAGKTIAGALDEHGLLEGTVDGEPFAVACHLSGREFTLFADGMTRRFRLKDPVAEATRLPQSSGRILAPMPGRVMLVHVKQHDKVGVNAPLVVLEAMKMEHVVRAPGAGLVAAIRVREGDQVNESDLLIELIAEP
jgi:3-methylcrotonyl-CoA carboxylase alpha subunit